MPLSKKRSKEESKSPLTSPTTIPAKYNYENMMKRHQLKHASIQFRNDLLKSRSNAAYKNELDRVNSMLHNHLLHRDHPNYQLLMHRKEHLKKLASEGLYPEHELYKTE